MPRLTKDDERYINARVKAEATDNISGRVKSIDASGMIIVAVDGFGDLPILNASGQDISVGDSVSLRTYGKSINTAEIAGLSAREIDTVEPTIYRR